MSPFWTISLFWICMLLFVCVALAFVLPPLLRRNQAPVSVDRNQANIAIYQDQLQELETDLQSGALQPDQYQSARLEIEKRVSEDVLQTDALSSAKSAQSGRWVGFALAGVIPLLSVFLYMVLGSPGVMTAPQNTTEQQQQHDAAAMVTSLENKLKQHPENAEGWQLLGRSYAVMGRFEDATRAMAKAAELKPEDAGVLADYAEVLAMSRGGNLKGKPAELISKALELNNKDEKVLTLAATAAFQQKQFSQSAVYWRQLLKVIKPDAELRNEIILALNDAEKAAGEPITANDASTGESMGGQQNAAPATETALAGTVSVSAQLRGKIDPEDTVFIYAQSPQGPKMPLAVLKIQAKQLPYHFTLDDSMAMTPNNKLSDYPQVKVSAHVSKSGQAMPQPGDLKGTIGPVKLGRKDLSVQIDAVQP